MSAPLSAMFEHNAGRFVVEAARYGSINLAVSSLYSFLAELSVRGEFWYPCAGDVVFDVGAAFGAYSLPALVDGAHVIAFEPDPPLYQALTMNIARNIVEKHVDTWNEGWNFGAFRTALSDAAGEHVYEADEKRPVFHATTVDLFCERNRVERLDWLKCDTEGHESNVLRGGEAMIRRCRPNLLLEAHEFLREGETADLLELVQSFGYEAPQILEAGIVNYIFAARRP